MIPRPPRSTLFPYSTLFRSGYPYGDDLKYRYVQVTSKDGYHVRYFYIDPSVKVGDKILVGDKLGVMQELGRRYPHITPHFHLEIKNPSGEIIDPHDYLGELE